MFLVEIKPKAIKDMRPFPSEDRDRILRAIQRLEDGLAGDIKRLTNFEPQFGLRVGDYRAPSNMD